MPSRVLLVAVALAAACDPTHSPREQFEREVVPILERRCAATVCHGVASDGELRGEVIDWSLFFVEVDGGGHIADLDGAYEASRRAIDRTAPEFSGLLRFPLPRAFGGLPHTGGDSFRSPDDPAYRALIDWIEREPSGGEDAPGLDEREALFAARVQPALVSAACGNANCHGLESAVPFRLDPGIGGRFSDRATRANYEAALTMLALDGDPLLSRLVRKALPLHDGGIVHRGGNTAFFSDRDDPRVEAIAAWACEERLARLGVPCGESTLRGIVFVRGPLAPGHAFDLDTWVPGTDLYYARVNGQPDLRMENIENLTEALHDGPADVRDPAVDDDGEWIAFAMRTSADGGHDLYRLRLADGEVQRLTDDAGPLPGGGTRTYRDPTFGPDGHIWFVSTRAGAIADQGNWLDADLYELDPQSGDITRRTWTPHIERKPVFFVHGEEAGGEISFSALRDLVPGQARAHTFRFPPDLSTEYHQHFGITPPEDFFYDMRELPDGRYLTLVGDLGNVWRAGRLGVIDRNFGPELNDGAPYAEPGLPGYAAPLTRLESGLYRDPVALPDGRVLVAHGPGDPTLDDPDAAFDLGIEVLTLAESPDGTGPRITERHVLIDETGAHDRDPEPVFVRQPAPLSETPKWTPESETGLFIHNGVPMIEALLSNLPPSGPKLTREDIAGVRLIEALSVTPKQRTTLTRQGPQRILAELELAADDTFQVEIPSGVAFRVQAIDADGMSVGVTHNRWFYVAPGQTIKQGVDARHYGQRCGACHGAADGDPTGAFPVVDAITGASITLSRYEAGDPRHPSAPTRLGDETRIAVDFAEDVQPILDRRCGECHGPDADFDLSGAATDRFNRAYEALLEGGHIDTEQLSARRSSLIERLTDRELGADDFEVPDSPGAPHAPGLEDDELLTLVRWIELGATWPGTVDP